MPCFTGGRYATLCSLDAPNLTKWQIQIYAGVSDSTTSSGPSGDFQESCHS